MASSNFLWYANYKGAVYPTDFHAASVNFNSTRPCHMRSLVELCAEKIVQDSQMTSTALRTVPRLLCESFLKEALVGNRDMATRCIIESWPFQFLPLRSYVPALFTSVLPVYNLPYLRELVKQGARYTTNLAHTFLEALQKGHIQNLKVLDLTGFPTAEVIVYFLATHCMLAHNEVRHETIRSLYEQAVQRSGGTEDSRGLEPMEPMEHSLPQDCSVVVKLDAFVTSESTHSELCKALKVSSFQNCKLKLLIGRLAMTCLGQARITLLLKQINPDHLTGLQLQYNALTLADFVRLEPVLKSLVCLESLDLACNKIFFHRDDNTCHAASRVFGSLPRLRRLDLSNNRVKGKLHILLKDLAVPLTFLHLAGCGLTMADMDYLSGSIHRQELVELGLSENNLEPCGRQLRDILAACASSLCVLQLDDCKLSDATVHLLQPSLPRTSSLMYVNCTQNPVSWNGQVDLLQMLAELVSLHLFKSSYPKECYEDEREEERLKSNFYASLVTLADKSSVRSLRNERLKVHLTELELELQYAVG